MVERLSIYRSGDSVKMEIIHEPFKFPNRLGSKYNQLGTSNNDYYALLHIRYFTTVEIDI